MFGTFHNLITKHLTKQVLFQKAGTQTITGLKTFNMPPSFNNQRLLDVAPAVLPTDAVNESQLYPLVSTITMNTSTYVLTITKYDGTKTTIDLPAEMAFVSASYDDVTQDLTFTLQNGSTVTVPLDDLVVG